MRGDSFIIDDISGIATFLKKLPAAQVYVFYCKITRPCLGEVNQYVLVE